MWPDPVRTRLALGTPAACRNPSCATGKSTNNLRIFQLVIITALGALNPARPFYMLVVRCGVRFVACVGLRLVSSCLCLRVAAPGAPDPPTFLIVLSLCASRSGSKRRRALLAHLHHVVPEPRAPTRSPERRRGRSRAPLPCSRPAEEPPEGRRDPLDASGGVVRRDDLAVLRHGVVAIQLLRLEELGPCPRGPRLPDDEVGRHVVCS